MKEVVIVIGQHRNEKSALYWSPYILEKLNERGYNTNLVENPEKRTLIEIVIQASQQGRIITERELKRILFAWETITLRKYFRNTCTFLIHNWNVNSIPFESDDEIFYTRDDCAGFPFFSDISELHDEPLADRIYFEKNFRFGDHLLIEIPHIIRRTYTQGEVEAAQRVFGETDFHLYDGYLLDTDMQRTEKMGWLSPKFGEILIKGIEYLLDKGYGQFFRE